MKRFLLIATTAVVVSLPASAQTMELIGRYSWMSTSVDAEVGVSPSVDPTRFELDNDTGWGGAFNVFWTRHLSTEVGISWVRPNVVITEARETRSITRNIQSTIAPVTAVVQYHFSSDGPWEMYLGAGASWTLFEDAEGDLEGIEDDDVGRIEFDADTGLVANLGFNIMLADNFSANIDAKYVLTDATATVVFASGSVSDGVDLSVDPMVISLGVGWRF